MPNRTDQIPVSYENASVVVIVQLWLSVEDKPIRSSEKTEDMKAIFIRCCIINNNTVRLLLRLLLDHCPRQLIYYSSRDTTANPIRSGLRLRIYSRPTTNRWCGKKRHQEKSLNLFIIYTQFAVIIIIIIFTINTHSYYKTQFFYLYYKIRFDALTKKEINIS